MMKVTLAMLQERITAHERHTADWMAGVDQRLAVGEARFDEIKNSLSVLCARTEGVDAIRSDIAGVREIVEAVAAAKQVSKVAIWVAKALKFVAGVVASCAALWAVAKAFARHLT